MTGLSYENYEKIWEEAKGILKEKIPNSTFEPWVLPITPAKENEEYFKKDHLVLKSDQSFGVSFLNQKYLSEIQSAINLVCGENLPVNLIFVPSNVKKAPKKKEKPSEHIVLMKEQIDNLKQMQSFCALNLKYTFENFVVGENSLVAYNAAKQVSEAPGQKFNPLFISGSVGIGKTHLMQAIGHSILKNFPDLRVKYAKAEEFTNQLVESCLNRQESTQKMKKFRDKYRNVDVLLLDDIQFAEGKKRTEEEIFHTFDALFHSGKQIVFASDRPISSFKNTPDRLKSRYEWGLMVDLLVPDFKTRVEIIEKHAVRSNFEISKDVAEFLAQTFDNNVRELEGAYNKVSAYASIKGIELTVDAAKEILGLKDGSKKITPDIIIEKCGEYFGVSSKDILSTSRSKEVKNARQTAIYLTREILDMSFPSIGEIFNKNHTTILYSYEKLKKDLITDRTLQTTVFELEKLVRQ
mgnify:CR=1 FL=1